MTLCEHFFFHKNVLYINMEWVYFCYFKVITLMFKNLSIKKVKISLLGYNQYTKYHIYFMYIIL